VSHYQIHYVVPDEEDTVVQQFQEGLETWEHPFRKASPA
jgi:hypothetical protein